MLAEVRNGFLNNINKICILMGELQDDSWLRILEMNKINALLDESLDYIWKLIYGKNREKNEINNIGIDKKKDIDEYVSRYMDIVNDKLELVSKLGELLDNIMVDIQNVVETNDYDELLKILKKYWGNIMKLIKPYTSKKKDNAGKKKGNNSKKKDNTSKKKDITSKKKDNASKKKDNVSNKKDNASEKKDNTSEKKDNSNSEIKDNTSKKKG